MIKICDNSYIRRFEYSYFFIMFIYMAQMTVGTNRMIAGIGAPWLPFLLPIVLTFIILWQNRVNLSSHRLFKILAICLVWEVCVTINKGLYSTGSQSFHFFLFYSIFIAYVHVQVFKKQIVPLYETVIVLFCKISLPLWALSVLLPSVMTSLASIFPETNLGHNLFYLYNYIDADSQHHLRNSGCAWEPGRFAIMIVLGIYCNILRNGVKFKKNNNIWWLLLTLLTTMSTTGYLITILVFVISIFRHLKKINPVYIFFLVPLVIYLFSLDFMSDKISNQIDLNSTMSSTLEQFGYHNQTTQQGKYIASLGRFESMYFEFDNLIHDPIVGYGRDTRNSYFYNNISSNFYLTGGIIKVLSMYGLFLGLYFYFLLYKSSGKLNSLYKGGSKFLLFVIILLSSVSYDIFIIPIFTAFWLYDLFDS